MPIHFSRTFGLFGLCFAPPTEFLNRHCAFTILLFVLHISLHEKNGVCSNCQKLADFEKSIRGHVIGTFEVEAVHVPPKLNNCSSASIYLRTAGIIDFDPPVIDIDRLWWRGSDLWQWFLWGNFSRFRLDWRCNCGTGRGLLFLAVLLRKEIIQPGHCAATART